MNEREYKADELPVLTEVVTLQQVVAGKGLPTLVVTELDLTESNPEGYDPYNNAPPVKTPQDNDAA